MNDTYKRVAVVAAACCMSVWGTPVLVVVVLGSQVTRAGMKAATKQRAAAAAYTKRPVHGRLREKEKNKNRARARARIFYTPTGCTTSNTSSSSFSSRNILEYNK